MPGQQSSAPHQTHPWLLDLTHSQRSLDYLQATLAPAKRTLVIIGGAMGLSGEDARRLEDLFTHIICPLAEAHHLILVDGGTDCGIMRLLGQARRRIGGTFPLIGVVVKLKTHLPHALPAEMPAEIQATADRVPLEPNHSHFVLVPGNDWGDESHWIAQVAALVCGPMASATLLINGGAIALHQDVPNSIQHRRPVLVVAGSGRSADRLAAALEDPDASADGPPSGATPLHTLIASGLIQSVSLHGATSTIRQSLEQMLEL